MDFDTWWKQGTSTKVPLYGEANAKKAWDYQQRRIDELEYQATAPACPICRSRGGRHKMDCPNAYYVSELMRIKDDEDS